MIVDDAAASRAALSAMVEALGYRAITASHGLEGLRMVRERRPSLVLLDVMMPDVDGYKIAAAIKAQPHYVPVLLLTSLNDLESKRRGQSAGADDFLSKPVSPLELQIRLAAMLRIKSLTDALDAANRRLTELALTDALTGLGNRRSFEEQLASERERADRYRRPLALLLADIDLFKRINDEHGHPMGDQVIREVARAFASMVRRSDRVDRVGGEEFAVLAPEARSSAAAVLGERLRAAVESLVFQLPEGKPLRVTISVGVAAWDGASPMEGHILYKHADDALYRAKRRGRNRVETTIVGESEAPVSERRPTLREGLAPPMTRRSLVG